MSYQTNVQEVQEIKHISFKIQSAERRKARIRKAINAVLEFIAMVAFSLIAALFFLYAWVEEDKRWNPPVENPAYVNQYETPDIDPCYTPEY